MPLRSSDATNTPTLPGAYTLSTETLRFSNTNLIGKVTITNNAPVGLDFVVRKLDHTEYTASGTQTITTNPMPWLSMGKSGAAPTRVPELQVFVEGNGGVQELQLGDPATPGLARWDGRIEISNPKLGARQLLLSYSTQADGRWSGTMYYFANFGDTGLEAWLANRNDTQALGQVGNAFLQRWGALRQGRLTYDEFQAVVTATVTESWKWDSVKKLCTTGAACYLYSQKLGYAVYSDSLDTYPIPTASSELPVALNLKTSQANPNQLIGKIVGGQSLHYAGDPAISLDFDSNPMACAAGVQSACLAPIARLSAEILMGGRYLTTKSDAGCTKVAAGTFTQSAIPWLIPGFTNGTEIDDKTGLPYRYECRDNLHPFGADSKPLNVSFAQSNPIPDGRSRAREIELVDGALINQDTLFIIFRERFTQSFLGDSDTQGFSAYGFMTLKRSPAELDSSAYAGNSPTDDRAQPTGVLQTTCSRDLLDRALGAGVALTSANTDRLAGVVLDGLPPGASPAIIVQSAPPSDTAEQVHYLCNDTGVFDGGPSDDAAHGYLKLKCPENSDITFFTTIGASLTRDFIAGLECQRPALNCTGTPARCDQATCQQTLNQWVANGSYHVRLKPIWKCNSADQTVCDARTDVHGQVIDPRFTKTFYQASATSVVFPPLLTTIYEAFRYKTKFVSRSGTTLGFVPSICVPNSNAEPYCYDPAQIELAQQRVDCAVDLFTNHYADLTTKRSQLQDFLKRSFGNSQDNSTSPPTVYDGFEKLDAELLIMLGDDAYTNAFASRFDLAGSRMVSFQGSLFEPNGIDLAGGAGNEMYNLYKATQYYQLVLDRFFNLSPSVWKSLAQGVPDVQTYITSETVEAYFDKLIRASTQKARAWSEISKRYQSFNRPDLGRAVVERAYAAAYLESIVLSRFMLRVVAVASPARRDYIVSRAELAALGYRASLLAMRDVYAGINDQPTYFGFAPDFIPFPALDPTDVNAFTKLLAAAKQSVATAGVKEALALASNRAFDTDAAQFQAELVRIRNSYEAQLGDLCGTLVSDDGLVHPAISTYAYLDERAKLMGDPCGLMNTGTLNQALGKVELIALDMRKISQQYDDVFAQIDIVNQTVNEQCQLIFQLADYKYVVDGQINDLASDIADSRAQQNSLSRLIQDAQVLAQMTKCLIGAAGSDCASGVLADAAYMFTALAADKEINNLDDQINDDQRQIADLQQAAAYWETEHQCDVLMVDANATVKKLLLGLKQIDLEALKTRYSMQLAYGDIQSLRNQATRLLAEQDEMLQQTINIQTAKDDPNVRIYKNDDIILADQTFNLAVADAYKATKVFEYYTSQSYAHLVDLFLVRMVSHGDYNLEMYLSGLENAYRDFQQLYGNPDTRVQIVSLRDDVLAVPTIGPDGHALSQSERIAQFRQRLTDASYIDERGYIRLLFATSLASLSPLTRNHKVLAVEAEIVGSDVGDPVGRLYVSQRGTGTVLSVAGDKSYYRFPQRTAVVNPFFNGVRVFTPEVYRTDHLRDRPLVNTQWEVTINKKDELANQDVNLQSLTDVRLYVYYSDFTTF